jgi:hypothetical protein
MEFIAEITALASDRAVHPSPRGFHRDFEIAQHHHHHFLSSGQIRLAMAVGAMRSQSNFASSKITHPTEK